MLSDTSSAPYRCNAFPREVNVNSPQDPSRNRWTHPSVLLVATDLSDLGRLMPYAFQQAKESGARLVLLHVLASGAAMAVDPAGLPYYDMSGALESATRAMEPWCEQARHQRIACDALVREGHAAQQIAIAVRQFQVDRILLGTRNRSRLGKLLLGSVAEQVLRSVNLPVMTVGPEAHLPVEEHEPVVLHATTLREASRPSAALACRISASRGAKLVLLHVLPPPDRFTPQGISLDDSLGASAMRALHTLANEARANCCSTVEPLVMHGNPPIEILAAAAERHANLIVLGATDHSVFETLTRERTIYRVLANARCPVLTLREMPPAPSTEEKRQVAAHS